MQYNKYKLLLYIGAYVAYTYG